MYEKLTGESAINYAESNGLMLSKHADPIEGHRADLSPDEAREIAKEDPSLIYLFTSVNDHKIRRIKIEDVRTLEDAEAYLNRASEEFHDDPSHPSSCLMYEEHYGRRCICEDRAEAELRARNF